MSARPSVSMSHYSKQAIALASFGQSENFDRQNHINILQTKN
jgi:hypothetical protein